MATSRAASARGRRDHGPTRDEALAHAPLIVDATDLPVSADLGNGFGDALEVVAETIRLAAGVGLVGCKIEDELRFPFVLTARAHNHLHAAPNLDDTISRLQSFEKAGADVHFCPRIA